MAQHARGMPCRELKVALKRTGVRRGAKRTVVSHGLRQDPQLAVRMKSQLNPKNPAKHFTAHSEDATAYQKQVAKCSAGAHP